MKHRLVSHFFVAKLRAAAVFAFIALSFVSVSPKVGCAQWTRILPAGFINYFQQGFGGAMEYKAGKLWVGLSKEIWMSPDDGANWQKVPLTLGVGELVYEISFFDANNGLVCAGQQQLYATVDGGQTWNIIKNYPGTCYSARFINSPNDIVATYDFPSPLISVSRNGGLTWDDHYKPLGGNIEQVQVRSDNAIYVMQLGANKGSFMQVSYDYGQTWTMTPGRFDNDCNAFALDYCDPNKLYVINEESLVPDDGFTDLFYTNDNCINWQKSTIKPFRLYACGSLIAPDHLLLYAQTLAHTSPNLSDGIIRSTDGGLTWKSIGGPNGMSDSRVLVAKDNNTLFAAGDDGSIWMTKNSGGDPVQSSSGGQTTLSFDQQLLFSTDTILPCAPASDAIRRALHTFLSGCNNPQIASQKIIGANSSDYTIITPAGNPLNNIDSVIFLFDPSGVGLRDASYEITLTDGRVFTIPLTGVGKAPTPLMLSSIVTLNVDTLGQEIQIPVAINGLSKAAPIQVTIFYDPANLEYLGTKSANGIALDVAGSQSPGTAVLFIPASEIQLSAQSAFSSFRVFADTLENPTVRFDLLSVEDPTVSCAYTTDTRTVTTVVIPKGCGVGTVSAFLHNQPIPGFSIMPNPSSGSVSISSTENLSDVGVDIVDALGQQFYNETMNLSKLSNHTLDLPMLKSGLYFLRLSSTIGERTLPLLIQK